MTIRQRVGLRMGLAAGTAVVAAFLSWGFVRVEDGYAGIVGFVPGNAWTSASAVNGLSIPNFLPALVAVSLAVWAGIDPRLGRGGFAPVLAGYGAVHGLLAARVPALGDAGGGGVAIGPVLTLAAFVSMLVAMKGVPDDPGSEPAARKA